VNETRWWNEVFGRTDAEMNGPRPSTAPSEIPETGKDKAFLAALIVINDWVILMVCELFPASEEVIPKFEFNERFLRRLLYHLYSCQYGTFLFNNEKERVESQTLRVRSLALQSTRSFSLLNKNVPY
jgi:hypothetical protein